MTADDVSAELKWPILVNFGGSFRRETDLGMGRYITGTQFMAACRAFLLRATQPHSMMP